MVVRKAQVDYPRDFGSKHIKDHITSWEHRYEFHTGKWAQTEYDFENPSADLMTKADAKPGDGFEFKKAKNYENYDYPGIYVNKGEGQPLTDTRIEEEESPRDVIHATRACRTFTPGGTFQVDEHRCDTEKGKKVVITSIRHQATETLAYETGGGAEFDYSNSFTCIPDSVTFGPARLLPNPSCKASRQRSSSANPVRRSDCDEYGRVKVQFYWDREGEMDENSSCWIRVANNLAGKKWGFIAIPRIGQEVVVEFLEGDPDRPLITGAVHNAEQMPHYELPDHKNKVYFKTNSTKGGDGYNELMFDDTDDEEGLFLHAQKNMDTRVLNDSKARTFGHRHQVIGWEKDGQKGGDQKERVWQDKHVNVKRDQQEHLEGNMALTIGHGEADDGGQLDVVIEKKELRKVGSDGQHLIVEGDCNEKIAQQYSLSTGSMHAKANSEMQLEATQEIHVKAGMKLILEAGMQVTMKGPGGFVDIGPAGVTIQGMTVKINSGGAAGTGGACNPTQPEEPHLPLRMIPRSLLTRRPGRNPANRTAINAAYRWNPFDWN